MIKYIINTPNRYMALGVMSLLKKAYEKLKWCSCKDVQNEQLKPKVGTVFIGEDSSSKPRSRTIALHNFIAPNKDYSIPNVTTNLSLETQSCSVELKKLQAEYFNRFLSLVNSTTTSGFDKVNTEANLIYKWVHKTSGQKEGQKTIALDGTEWTLPLFRKQSNKVHNQFNLANRAVNNSRPWHYGHRPAMLGKRQLKSIIVSFQSLVSFFGCGYITSTSAPLFTSLKLAVLSHISPTQKKQSKVLTVPNHINVSQHSKLLTMNRKMAKKEANIERPEGLGQWLKALRKARELTLTEAAKRADISKGYLSLIEAGKNIPDVQVLKKIGKVLDIHYSILLMAGDTGPEEKEIFGRFHNTAEGVANWLMDELKGDEEQVKLNG